MTFSDVPTKEGLEINVCHLTSGLDVTFKLRLSGVREFDDLEIRTLK